MSGIRPRNRQLLESEDESPSESNSDLDRKSLGKQHHSPTLAHSTDPRSQYHENLSLECLEPIDLQSQSHAVFKEPLPIQRQPDFAMQLQNNKKLEKPLVKKQSMPPE